MNWVTILAVIVWVFVAAILAWLIACVLLPRQRPKSGCMPECERDDDAIKDLSEGSFSSVSSVSSGFDEPPTVRRAMRLIRAWGYWRERRAKR